MQHATYMYMYVYTLYMYSTCTCHLIFVFTKSCRIHVLKLFPHLLIDMLHMYVRIRVLRLLLTHARWMMSHTGSVVLLEYELRSCEPHIRVTA